MKEEIREEQLEKKLEEEGGGNGGDKVTKGNTPAEDNHDDHNHDDDDSVLVLKKKRNPHPLTPYPETTPPTPHLPYKNTNASALTPYPTEPTRGPPLTRGSRRRHQTPSSPIYELAVEQSLMEPWIVWTEESVW